MVRIINIIYKPTQKIIKSSNILYIYDFGYMKGFLINNDFKLYTSDQLKTEFYPYRVVQNQISVIQKGVEPPKEETE